MIRGKPKLFEKKISNHLALGNMELVEQSEVVLFLNHSADIGSYLILICMEKDFHFIFHIFHLTDIA